MVKRCQGPLRWRSERWQVGPCNRGCIQNHNIARDQRKFRGKDVPGTLSLRIELLRRRRPCRICREPRHLLSLPISSFLLPFVCSSITSCVVLCFCRPRLFALLHCAIVFCYSRTWKDPNRDHLLTSTTIQPRMSLSESRRSIQSLKPLIVMSPGEQ